MLHLEKAGNIPVLGFVCVLLKDKRVFWAGLLNWPFVVKSKYVELGTCLAFTGLALGCRIDTYLFRSIRKSRK